MAYAMTKRGSQDNIITYEFICDTISDMNAIENKYRTLGTIAIVLSGESEGLEVYIAGSNKSWNSLSTVGAADPASAGGLSIYICSQNEVSSGLPNVSEPDESTIYLVGSGNTSGNLYEEYIYVDGAWEKFGAASIDLSNYATKSEIPDVSGFYTKPSGGIPAADLAETYLTQHQDISGLAPKANPVFTDSISLERKANTMIGHNSVAVGSDTTASGHYSYAEGYSTTASEFTTHAEGNSTTASGISSHAEGDYALASGTAAHAEGYGGSYTLNNVTYTSEAKGTADHTEGYLCLTRSGQPGNHAEGYQTQAIGGASHSEGANTVASGTQSHAEGYSTTASGSQSHSEGNYTIASGAISHSEGTNSIASGPYSHAEGEFSTASGWTSHAEGKYTIAIGSYSHVSGQYNVADSYDNWPEWIANTSYIIGDKVKRTITSNDITTVYTYICKTANSDSSFTSSKWIDQSGQMNYAEIVGNGSGTSDRSNARALDWNGNEYLKGDLYVGCNADSTGGTKVATVSQLPDMTSYAPKANPEFTGSISMGRKSNTTVGMHSIAIGLNNSAAGDYSAAIGSNCSSGAAYGLAVGYCTSSGDQRGQIVFGSCNSKYNRSDKIMIAGNGTASTDSNRSNAYALDTNGNGRYAGDLYVNCNNDSTGGSKVATEAFVTARVPAPPVADGTYNLQVSVSSGTATYSWVAAPGTASGVNF